MKVVILAGGFGTRISEESHLKPKPMIEIGGKPILWHIMKEYSHYGFNDFIICLGYKSFVVKDYFANYYLHKSDVTIDLQTGEQCYHQNHSEPWKVTLVNTGLHTMTGGRIKRVREYIGNEPFLLTYGDGVSNVNIADTVRFHKEHGKLLTMTTVNVASRFGVIKSDKAGNVKSFREKADADGSIINAGYMVCQPEVIDYIEDDSTIFERTPMERIAADGQLMAYRHEGFWKCMDTLRDKEKLEALWESGEAEWKVW
jgi:glucose-1-phosphate cytidylyltransferase